MANARTISGLSYVYIHKNVSQTPKGEIVVTNPAWDAASGAAREVKAAFEAWIEPHRAPLWRYCRSLTGSPWDGEDLFQETLLKAFATLSQRWHPSSPKSYVFRIASNAWIDQLRKRRIEFDRYEEERIVEEAPDPLLMREALEVLVASLPPRQAMIVLLMDVFAFSGAETAGMVRMTEGAVYAALRRARVRLRAQREQEQAAVPAAAALALSAEHRRVIESMVEAMRDGSTERFLRLLDDTYSIDAGPGFQEYSKAETKSGSLGDFGHTVRATLHMLWGKPALVVQILEEGRWLLHDLSLQEVDNGKIVRHHSFYFCKELLLEAGRTLQMPVQLVKAPGLDWT